MEPAQVKRLIIVIYILFPVELATWTTREGELGIPYREKVITKPMAKVPPTLLSRSVTSIWESWFLNEGHDDQWTVPEMWLSACVGVGSRKTLNSPNLLSLSLIFSLVPMYKTATGLHCERHIHQLQAGRS